MDQNQAQVPGTDPDGEIPAGVIDPEGPDVDPRRVLTEHEIAAALLPDWRILHSALCGRFATGDFATGAELVAGIAKAAEKADHHPDVDLSYGYVEVRSHSHDVGGVTSRDVALARTIGELAGALDATAHPELLSSLEIGLDTVDADAVRPFWAALLGYEESERADELVDPGRRGFSLWFQQIEGEAPTETPAQRFHFDLRVPPEQAEARVRKAVEAGGTMVSDARAPAFWVLADAQGNQCCVTTWMGRDDATA